MRPSGSTGIRVVGVRVRDIGSYGMFLDGSDHLVMDCTVMNVGQRVFSLEIPPWSRVARWWKVAITVSFYMVDL